MPAQASNVNCTYIGKCQTGLESSVSSAAIVTLKCRENVFGMFASYFGADTFGKVN